MITVRIESEGKLLVVEAGDTLTAEDYETVFLPKLESLIERHGKVRVVFYFNPSFQGWQAGALWDDAKFGLRHSADFERIAMVGGPRWAQRITELGERLIPGEVKSFPADNLSEAIAWANR